MLVQRLHRSGLGWLEGFGVRGPASGLAIVTGGSSGIGKACAAALLARGHAVVLIARDAERLAAAQSELLLRHPGSVVRALSVDVGDRAACMSAIDKLIESHGAPEWVVCSAGIAKPGLFLKQPLDEHAAQLQTNYLGTLHAISAAAPAMAAAGHGRIVLIASGAAFFGIYGYSAYAPSKFAIRGLAEVLRLELAPCGISVTVACPPDTLTPQLEAETLSKPEITRKITAGGGLWRAEDVAKAMIDGAARGRFFVGPGWAMHALAMFHSLVAPIFRLRQLRMIRHERMSGPDGRHRQP